MSPVWPVIGELVEPANRSGVHGGFGRRCTCNPSVGDSCRECDGMGADEWEATRAARDAERTRDRRMADPSQRAAWLASLPPLTRALFEPVDHVEEAS